MLGFDMPTMIRVVVIDDHAVVRAGICRLLDHEPDITVVADCGLGREGVELCRLYRPHLAVLDYNLPDIDGLEAARLMIALEPKPRILVLTQHSSEEYAIRVIRAGASGFVPKVASVDEVLSAVRRVASGGIYVSPALVTQMTCRLGLPTEDMPESLLSNRELQVLVRLALGSSTREVAQLLKLSPSTVETYRSRMLKKLCLRNNADITRFAIRRGLIDSAEHQPFD